MLNNFDNGICLNNINFALSTDVSGFLKENLNNLTIVGMVHKTCSKIIQNLIAMI